MDIDYTRNKLIEIIQNKGISEKFLSLPGVMERIAEDEANMLENRIFVDSKTPKTDNKATSFTYSSVDDRFMRFEMLEDGKTKIHSVPRQSNATFPEETIILDENGIDIERKYLVIPGNYSIIRRMKGIIEENYYIRDRKFSTYQLLDDGNWRLADSDRHTLGIPLTVSYHDFKQKDNSRFEEIELKSEKQLAERIRHNSEKIVLLYPNCKEYFDTLLSNAKQAYRFNMDIMLKYYNNKNNSNMHEEERF